MVTTRLRRIMTILPPPWHPASMTRIVGLGLSLLLTPIVGCGGDRAPPAASRDGSVRETGSGDGGAGGDGATERRDGGPEYPAVDLEVVLPYGAPEQTTRIEVAADIGRLDVHFSIDTTGSFGEEIDAIQSDLGGGIVPGLRDRVDDVAFGVSRFEDMPDEPWGLSTDAPFELLAPVTRDVARVASAVAALDDPLGHGGDAPESGAEALYQIATGDGYRAASRTIVPRYSGSGIGGVGFREGAFHVVVHVTDAPTHEPSDYGTRFPGTRGTPDAADALAAIGARVVGIASGEAARPYLELLALSTSATMPAAAGECPTGVGGAGRPPARGVCPMVFDVASDGTGVSDTIVDAIVELVNGVAYDEVFGEAIDDPLAFVRAIEASDASPAEGALRRADLRPPGDGVEDTFVDVHAGTRLGFTVRLANGSLRPADYDQVFHLVVQIRGDELLLARRRIRVIVPRGRLDAGTGMDAGAGEGADAGEGGATDAATDGGGTAGVDGATAGVDGATATDASP